MTTQPNSAPDAEREACALQVIAQQLQWWLDFNERGHNGAPITDDMHVISPAWPTRGVLKNWIAALLHARPKWISVDDRLPESGHMVLVYAPPQPYDWPDSYNINFDCIDPDSDDQSVWLEHSEHYEHWCCVGKPEGSIGPSEKAPYTHWMPLPDAPHLVKVNQI